MWGVFEQLARYMIRYQESDLHLGLYSSLTSANNLNLLTLLLYSILTLLLLTRNSSFYSHSWTCLADRGNKIKVNSVGNCFDITEPKWLRLARLKIQTNFSLRGRRSKGKGKGIRARDHTLSNSPFLF